MPFIATIHPDVIATIAVSRAAPSSTDPVRDLGSSAVRRVAPRQPWPAGRAGIRLGMKPPICRVVVLRLALRAHRETRHRRRRTVVGHTEHDRVAGSAVRAVGEGVAVPPIIRIVDLGEAVAARAGVDADRHIGRAGVKALDDAEPGALARREQAFGGDTDDSSKRRRIFDQHPRQFRDALRRAFDLDQHAGAVVQHEADETECDRVAIDERAEADALHGSGDPQPLPGDRAGGHGVSRCGGGGRRPACRRSESHRSW